MTPLLVACREILSMELTGFSYVRTLCRFVLVAFVLLELRRALHNADREFLFLFWDGKRAGRNLPFTSMSYDQSIEEFLARRCDNALRTTVLPSRVFRGVDVAQYGSR